MVLQQQGTVKIWGSCEPGEKIALTTSWNNKTYNTIGTGHARFEINIATPIAGGPYQIKLKGNNNIVLQNILIGEVWVCSGQSNMEMCEKWGLPDVKAELPTANNPNIRFFHIPRTSSPYPQDNSDGNWTACDSNSLRTFSAVAYFFGKKLNRQLNVPIGLIEASWGGTTAEVWTPDSVVNNDPVLKEAAKKNPPNTQCPVIPGLCYNAMIAPITNYSIAGTIWYQGENNTGTASTYSQLFKKMIDSWRKMWKKNFPFYYVQIAPFKYKVKHTGALLREAQQQSMDHPNTGMVVTTDLVADTNNVHPINKHDVGLRLANWALAETYQKKTPAYKSPFFKNIRIKGNKALLEFQEVGSGLMMKGKTPIELVIAGDDQVFHPAEATIKHNVITVWSKAVARPAAVRFGFRDAAIGNLFSKDGLPVIPFRTDNWPVQQK